MWQGVGNLYSAPVMRLCTGNAAHCLERLFLRFSKVCCVVLRLFAAVQVQIVWYRRTLRCVFCVKVGPLGDRVTVDKWFSWKVMRVYILMPRTVGGVLHSNIQTYVRRTRSSFNLFIPSFLILIPSTIVAAFHPFNGVQSYKSSVSHIRFRTFHL